MRTVHGAGWVARHSIGAVTEALLIVAIIIGLLVAVAPLLRGGGDLGVAGSVAAAGRGVIVVPDGLFAGQTTATVNPGGSTAWAWARCYQDDSLVYQQWVRVNAENQATFTLGPTQLWTSGTANCVAEEGTWNKNNRWQRLASTTFMAWGE